MVKVFVCLCVVLTIVWHPQFKVPSSVVKHFPSLFVLLLCSSINGFLPKVGFSVCSLKEEFWRSPFFSWETSKCTSSGICCWWGFDDIWPDSQRRWVRAHCKPVWQECPWPPVPCWFLVFIPVFLYHFKPSRHTTAFVLIRWAMQKGLSPDDFFHMLNQS